MPVMAVVKAVRYGVAEPDYGCRAGYNPADMKLHATLAVAFSL
jgi:hypothetical protein